MNLQSFCLRAGAVTFGAGLAGYAALAAFRPFAPPSHPPAVVATAARPAAAPSMPVPVPVPETAAVVPSPAPPSAAPSALPSAPPVVEPQPRSARVPARVPGGRYRFAARALPLPPAPPYYGPARPRLRAGRAQAEERAARTQRTEAQVMPPPHYEVYYPVQIYSYPWPYWTYRPIY